MEFLFIILYLVDKEYIIFTDKNDKGDTWALQLIISILVAIMQYWEMPSWVKYFQTMR